MLIELSGGRLFRTDLVDSFPEQYMVLPDTAPALVIREGIGDMATVNGMHVQSGVALGVGVQSAVGSSWVLLQDNKIFSMSKWKLSILVKKSPYTLQSFKGFDCL